MSSKRSGRTQCTRLSPTVPLSTPSGTRWPLTLAQVGPGSGRPTLAARSTARTVFVSGSSLAAPDGRSARGLDTVVPETGTRLVVGHLYRSSEHRPATSISVAADRPATTVAKEITRRLLPGLRDALTRLNARRFEQVELLARRQRAVEAILRVVPSAHQRNTPADHAPHLFIGSPLALDVLIDDADQITITRWSGLDIDTTVRLLAAALTTAGSA